MNRRKLKEKEHHISAWRRFLLVGTVVLIILTLVIAWMIYDYGVLRTGTHAGETLEAVARLKSTELSRWYEDQLDDVWLLATNDLLTGRLQAWRRTGEKDAEESLAALLGQQEREHDISRLQLCTADGRILHPPARSDHTCGTVPRSLLQSAAVSNHAVSSDIHLCGEDSTVVIDFAARMLMTDSPGEVFLVARCEAESTVFPMAESWPLPSRTAESYLVRAEDDSLVFLSNLRFLSDAPLHRGYRRPDLDTLLARTGDAGTGLSRGVDYRGVRVLTYMHDVPGTPWHLIAEMDEAEVFDTAWAQTRLLIILVISISAAIIAIAFFFNSRHQTKVYRQMLALEKRYADGQKRLQQEIRKSERRYRAMFEVHRAVKLVVAADTGEILDANHAAANYYGWTREQLRGMSMHQINTLPFDRLSVLMREAVDSDKTKYEMRHCRADASVRDVEVFASYVDFEGRDAIYSVIHDVTEKKRMEEWNRLLGRAIEQSSVSVMILRTDGTILYVNPELAAVLGRPADELIGRSVNLLKTGEEDDALYRNIERAVLEGDDWQGEFHRWREGEIVWHHTEISPVVYECGKVTHVIAILTDITAEKQLIEDLIVAKEKAEESDRLKSAFLANMSHEIRTPLNAIIGFAGLLAAPELSRDEVGEYSDVIKQRSFDLLNILNDILDISMIEARQIRLVEEACCPAAVLQDLYVTFSELIRREGRTDLELRITDDAQGIVESIRTDPYRLRQVLSILLSNAIKFTPRGQVAFGCRREDSGWLRFHVTDTGIGIDSGDLEIIFDRFRQVEHGSTRRFEGNGLGLAIAQGIIELMGGSITVDSRKGEGSTFSFTIPLKQAV